MNFDKMLEIPSNDTVQNTHIEFVCPGISNAIDVQASNERSNEENEPVNINNSLDTNSPMNNINDEAKASQNEKDSIHISRKRTHTCTLCNNVFRNKKLLSDHQRTVHNQKQVKMHHCANCDKKFHRPIHLKIHMRVHTGEKPVHCELCQKNFPSKNALMRHQKTAAHVKREQGRDVEVEKKYLCEECGSRFCALQTLTRHIESIHKETKLFHCSYCDYSSKYETNLKRHIECHANIKNFICEICGLSFHTRTCLRKHHSWVHSDKRDFMCEMCSKSFKERNSLLRHLRAHSEDRPFKCFCNKTYKRMSHLKRHVETAHQITVTSKKLQKINLSNKQDLPSTDDLSPIASELPDMLLHCDDMQLSNVDTDHKSTTLVNDYIIDFSESLREYKDTIEELELSTDKDSNELSQLLPPSCTNLENVWDNDTSPSSLKIGLPDSFLQQQYDCEPTRDVCLWADNNFMPHEFKDLSPTSKLTFEKVDESSKLVQTLSSQCLDNSPISVEHSDSEWLISKVPKKLDADANSYCSVNSALSPRGFEPHLMTHHDFLTTDADVELGLHQFM